MVLVIGFILYLQNSYFPDTIYNIKLADTDTILPILLLYTILTL